MNLPNTAIWRADTEAYSERTLTETSSIHSTKIYHHPKSPCVSLQYSQVSYTEKTIE